jgi:hypothetical protein
VVRETAARASPSHAEAIMLDFMKPLRPGRNLGCIGRQAELKRLKHAPKIGIGKEIAFPEIFPPPVGRR